MMHTHRILRVTGIILLIADVLHAPIIPVIMVKWQMAAGEAWLPVVLGTAAGLMALVAPTYAARRVVMRWLYRAARRERSGLIWWLLGATVVVLVLSAAGLLAAIDVAACQAFLRNAPVSMLMSLPGGIWGLHVGIWLIVGGMLVLAPAEDDRSTEAVRRPGQQTCHERERGRRDEQPR